MTVHKYKWQKMMIILFGIILTGWGHNPIVQAQTATPPVMAVPTIAINSIALDEDRNVFRVQLLLTNQGLLWELDVKIESARGGVLAYQTKANVQSQLEFPAERLQRGEEYNLTITGLNPAGMPFSINVPGNFGAMETRMAQAERDFTFTAAPQPEISIQSVDLLVGEQTAYLVTIRQQNTSDVTVYRAWLEDETTSLRATQDLVFNVPLPNPLTIPLDAVATGRYRIVLNALNGEGEIIANDTRQNVVYTRPQVNILQQVQGTPILIGFIGLVTLTLLGVILRFTLFKPRSDEYRIQAGTFRGHAGILIEDREKSIHKIDQKRREDLKRAANLTSNPQIAILRVAEAPLSDYVGQDIPISFFPFSIGREKQSLSIPLSNISGFHAYITCENGIYYIEDETSRNNTYVNNIPIRKQGKQLLKDGDEIRIASDVILYFYNSL